MSCGSTPRRSKAAINKWNDEPHAQRSAAVGRRVASRISIS